MKRILNDTALLGKTAFIVLLLATIVDIFMQGNFYQMLRLDTQLTSAGYELWRLVTFPFVLDTFPSTLLFVAVFLIILPQLADRIPKQMIVPLSIVLVMMQSVVFTLLFWGERFLYGGMDGLSIFYLMLTMMLIPNSRIFFLNRHLGRNMTVGTLMLLLWIAGHLITFELSGVGIVQGALAPLSSLAYGSVAALAVFLNLKLIGKYMNKKIEPAVDIPKIPTDKLREVYEDRNFERITSDYVKSDTVVAEKKVTMISLISEETHLTSNDEDIMNQILDKIHSHGEKSLTEDEKQTLLLLSKKA